MPPNGEENGSATEPISASGKKNKIGIDNEGLEMSTMDVSSKEEEAEGSKQKGEKKHDPWSEDAKEKKKTVKKVPWSELTGRGKAKRVLWGYIGKPLILIGTLYLFICSLDILSSAFRLLGGKAAGAAFGDNELLKNPVAGLMVGVLATVLLQSSSTTSSIVISMVAGNVMNVRMAIPIIMGANIGTSVTNTIVSMGHVGDSDEFRRAFAGATIHDMFNWLSVLVFLPLEEITHYLEHLTNAIVDSMPLEKYESGKQELLKAITKPLTALVITVDSSQITEIATHHGHSEGIELIKIWCEKTKELRFVNVTKVDVTLIGGVNVTKTYFVQEWQNVTVGVKKCVNMFMDVSGVWSDEVIGAILLVFALLLLCSCLVVVVKILNSILEGSIAGALKKFVNADFPGKLSWLTGYVAILVGAGMTVVVQSSSVFTSTLTPLVGVGVLNLERMYPLTLGSNIGTTATGMLVSLAASGDTLADSLKVAFTHLFFNISGILLWYPIPILRRVPIRLAMFLGETTARYRWFALFYLFMMFFVAPGLVFALSLAGWYVLLAVAAPFVILIIIVIIINVMQNKCPLRLPVKLRDWFWLPLCMRSLEPLDRLFRIICVCCKCCRTQEENTVKVDVESADDDVVPIVISRESSRDGIRDDDPELGGTTNPGFEDDDTAKKYKQEPEVKVKTETEIDNLSVSSSEPEVKPTSENKTVEPILGQGVEEESNTDVTEPETVRINSVPDPKPAVNTSNPTLSPQSIPPNHDDERLINSNINYKR